MEFKERVQLRGVWRVSKFGSAEALRRNQPYEIGSPFENIFVTVGLAELWMLVTGQGGIPFSAANAFLGVGDSVVAPAVGQTDLLGANKVRAGMNGGFPPAPIGGVEQWQADFGPAVANFSWDEFACFNAAAAGTMLNRTTSAQGVKPPGDTWRLTLTITIS